MALVPQTWFGSVLAALPGHGVRWNSLNHVYLSDAESGGSDSRIMAPCMSLLFQLGRRTGIRASASNVVNPALRAPSPLPALWRGSR